jgi:hypothetical protein
LKSKSKLQISKTDSVKTNFDIKKKKFDSIYFDFGIDNFFKINHACPGHIVPLRSTT